MMTKGKRGFASMPREKQVKIAAMGGKKAHELGRGHQFTPEEAAIAGRKGGLSHSKEHMSRIAKIAVAARRLRKKNQLKRVAEALLESEASRGC